jgi:hypothetical protein
VRRYSKPLGCASEALYWPLAGCCGLILDYTGSTVTTFISIYHYVKMVKISCKYSYFAYRRLAT